MSEHPTVLAVLLEGRGLHRYGSFCAAYHQAAGALDKQLARSVPSRAQFHRWLTGELRGLGMAGVVAVFTSRSEFAATVDPASLFDSARRVRAAGLSLNLICQQVPDQFLR